MDRIQQSLCDTIKQNPACLAERNIFRAALADCLQSDKLKQNLLLNAFDLDVVQKLCKGSDITFSALNCISQLESDYGITKDAAFWSIQTWCYLLGMDSVAEALVVLQPTNQATGSKPNVNVITAGAEYKIGLGVYRAGTDFPSGDVSVQITTKPEYSIYYGVGKNPNRIQTNQDFMDKMYVHIEEGQFLKLESVGAHNYVFIVKGIS